MSLFQKKFVNTAESWNDLVTVTKIVAFLANSEISGPKLVHMRI